MGTNVLPVGVAGSARFSLGQAYFQHLYTSSEQYCSESVERSKAISKRTGKWKNARACSTNRAISAADSLGKKIPIRLLAEGWQKVCNGSLFILASGLSSPPMLWYTNTLSASMLIIPQWLNRVSFPPNRESTMLVKSVPIRKISAPCVARARMAG